jgi:hypothetical protein
MFTDLRETARETASQQYDRGREAIDRWTSDDEPDGRNAGIEKSEALLAYAAAIGTTFLVRNLLQAGWKTALDRDPPKNPASHEVAWREALIWGAISGAAVGMARIGSRRASTAAYRNWRE